LGITPELHEDHKASFSKLLGKTLKSLDSLASLDIGRACDDDFHL